MKKFLVLLLLFPLWLAGQSVPLNLRKNPGTNEMHPTSVPFYLAAGQTMGFKTGSIFEWEDGVIVSEAQKVFFKEALGITDGGSGSGTDDYNDLINKPTLGTAAAKNVGTTSNDVAAGNAPAQAQAAAIAAAAADATIKANGAIAAAATDATTKAAAAQAAAISSAAADATVKANAAQTLAATDATTKANAAQAAAIAAAGIDATNKANAAVVTANAYTDTAVAAGVADGDKGEITVSGTGTVYTIDAGTITAAKIAAALKPSGTATAGDEALRALGTTANTAAAGTAPAAAQAAAEATAAADATAKANAAIATASADATTKADAAIAAAATDATTKANAAIAAAATDATAKADAAQAAAAADATTKANAAAAASVPTTRTVNGHALSGNVTVTASDVGLGSVNNTADSAKPVSTAQAAADAAVLSSAATDATTKANAAQAAAATDATTKANAAQAAAIAAAAADATTKANAALTAAQAADAAKANLSGGNTFSGVQGFPDATLVAQNTLAAFVINTAKGDNRKTISSSQVFTFSTDTPTTGTKFPFTVSNSGGSAVTVTLSSATPIYSVNHQVTITTFTVLAGGTEDVLFIKEPSRFVAYGLPTSINELTADASPDPTSDYVMTYDASAGAPKKVLLKDLPTSTGGEIGDITGLQDALDAKADTSYVDDAIAGTSVPTGGYIAIEDDAALPAGFLLADGTEGTRDMTAITGGLVWVKRTTGTAPELVSLTIPAAGDTIEALFNEPVQDGADGFTGLTLFLSGGDVVTSYLGGDGTDTLTYSLSRTVPDSETGTADYTQPGDGIQDLIGNDLASFSGAAIDNQSEATSAITYLLEQDFETGAIPSGWATVSGSPNYNYATSPAPLVGTYSLGIDGTDSTRGPFASQSDVWVYQIVNWSSNANAPFVLTLQNASSSPVVRVRIGTNKWRLSHGTTISDDTGTATAGTTYHLWLHYVAGSGANGVAELYVSTNSTKPGSPTVSIPNGQATTSADRWFSDFAASTVIVYDKVRVAATEIGSNPL